MSWTPISGTVPQYQQSTGDLASAYYLKFYESGTATAFNMATDSTGGTTLDKCQLDSSGYPTTDGSTRFIPHVNQKYKIVLYKNATDADNNTTANADWVIDALEQSSSTAETEKVFETVSDMVSSATLSIGDHVRTLGYSSIGDGGQNEYDIVPAGTGTADDGSFIDLSSHQAKGLFPNYPISIAQFGAALNGVADDSTEANGQAAYCNYIYIPKGKTALIASNINAPASGFSIFGADFTSTIKFSGNNRRITTDYGDYYMHHLTIDGAKPNVGYETTNNTDYGCLVGDAAASVIKGFKFDYVRFKDIGLDGIRLENCDDVEILPTCEFINCRRWGVTVIPDAYGMDNISIKGRFDSDFGGGPVGKEYPLGAVDTEPNAAHPSLDMTNIRYSDIQSNRGEIAILDKEFDTLDSVISDVSVTNAPLRVYNNRFNIKGADISGSLGYFKADITDSIATEINHVDITFTNTGRSEVRDSTNNRLNLIAADYVDESALGIGVSSSGTGTSSGKVLTDVDGESVYLRQMSLTTGTGTYLFPQTLNATISTNDQVILYLEVERTDSNSVTAPFFFVSLGSAGNIVSTTKLLSTGVNKMCIALQSGATVASCPINFGLSGTVNAQVDCLIRKCFLYVNPDKFNNEMLDVSSVEVTGSYTGTATGISGSPSGSISYTRKGNIVTLTIPSGVFTGTSTSIAFTITGAPIIIRPTASRVGLGRGVDNSAGLTNPISMEMTTAGTLTISSDMAGGTWTASGTKAVSNTTITYNVE